ncbi:PAS domain-containing protein [Henriciella aquimarina]|uniref:PAS domain-containing protein n=1 Tax=Henriciella aquimarina TaxID=545261 RepID=UPI0009FC437E|nr:PAS domain-containing protein [Henriciella aquimarina]
MYKTSGFRGLSAAQREIITHWNTVRGDRVMPDKSDIDPGTLRAHLGSISIVEIDRWGEARFRIAGTKLRQIFGGEVRGLSLKEIAPDKAEMWSLGLSASHERGEPVGGIIERRFDRHAWLRLPLHPGPGFSGLVLCHDLILVPEKQDDPDRSSLFSTISGSLAA